MFIMTTVWRCSLSRVGRLHIDTWFGADLDHIVYVYHDYCLEMFCFEGGKVSY